MIYMNKFLKSNNLSPDVNNITENGKTAIKEIIDLEYIDAVTNKIKSSLIPQMPATVNNISVVANLTERNNLIPLKGDTCIVIDIKETYIYDGSNWLEFLTNDTLLSLQDVFTTTLNENDLLKWDPNVNGGSWTTTQEYKTHIDDISKHHIFNNLVYLDPINQTLSTSGTPTWPKIFLSEMIILQTIYNPPLGLFGVFLGTNQEMFFQDASGPASLRQLVLNSHFHNNKSFLDNINQTLSNTSTPTFNSILINGYLNFVLAVQSTPAFQAIYLFPDGSVRINDGIGEINTRDLETDRHIHNNKAFLDNINQNLSTGANVIHNKLNLYDLDFSQSTPHLKTILFKDSGVFNYYSGIDTQTNDIIYHSGPNNITDGHLFTTYDPTGRYSTIKINRFQLIMNDSMEFISNDLPIRFRTNTIGTAPDVRINTPVGSINTADQIIIGDDNIITRAALYIGPGNGTLTQQFSIFNKSFLIPSDQRIKHEITDISKDDIINKINSVRVVNFKYKYGDQTILNKGFIAQELEVNPFYSSCVQNIGSYTYINAISNEPNTITDMKIVNDEKITSDLIVCVQKLILEIAALKTRIQTLENTIF